MTRRWFLREAGTVLGIAADRVPAHLAMLQAREDEDARPASKPDGPPAPDTPTEPSELRQLADKRLLALARKSLRNRSGDDRERIKAARAEAKARDPGFRVRSRRRPQDESHAPEPATPGEPAERRRRRPTDDGEGLGR